MITVKESFDFASNQVLATAFGLQLTEWDRCFVLSGEGSSGLGLMSLKDGEAFITAAESGSLHLSDLILRTMLYDLSKRALKVVITAEGDYGAFGFMKTERGWENFSSDIRFPHYCKES